MAGDEEKSPYARPGFLLAGIFLAVVVVAAVVMLTMNRSGSPGKATTTSPTAGTASPGASATSNGAAAGCHPTDTNQAIPTTAPADVTWTIFYGVAMPTSRGDGPLAVEGDIARCYADTPIGAVIAAWQFIGRAEYSPQWRTVVAKGGVEGPSRDAYIKFRDTDQSSPGPNASTYPGSKGQLAGFKVIAYSRQLSVVQLVGRSPAGAFSKLTATMQWADGDWKLQFQQGGGIVSEYDSVDSLDGFIPWAGV